MSTFLQCQVYTLTQLFTRFEVGNMFFRHFHAFAGFRVAPDTGRAVVQVEAAEAADSTRSPFSKALADFFDDEFDGFFYVLAAQLRVAHAQAVYQFGFGHVSSLAVDVTAASCDATAAHGF